jgi:hypothetical protein
VWTGTDSFTSVVFDGLCGLFHKLLFMLETLDTSEPGSSGSIVSGYEL